MVKLAALALLLGAGACNGGSGLAATGDMGTDDGGCAAFRACYTQTDMSSVNCQPGFSPLAIARAGELDECELVVCLSDTNVSPRACESDQDSSPACKQCLENAERGGPLPCTPPNDPHCGACSGLFAACYGY